MANIYTLSGPDSLTVYWELPARPAARYDVFLDGARRGSRAVSRLLLAAFVTCWYSVRYKRPCFALQNMAFCNVKRGLSPCRLPPLAARFAVNTFHLNI